MRQTALQNCARAFRGASQYPLHRAFSTRTMIRPSIPIPRNPTQAAILSNPTILAGSLQPLDLLPKPSGAEEEAWLSVAGTDEEWQEDIEEKESQREDYIESLRGVLVWMKQDVEGAPKQPQMFDNRQRFSPTSERWM
ncbi:MAG: hypothetical protein Q9221_000904 [Calogaya cf. arnoldii]